ncbi:MAG: prenyltransferase/squalene oxidase repeat-containing protein [Pirellulales bacterium]
MSMGFHRAGGARRSDHATRSSTAGGACAASDDESDDDATVDVRSGVRAWFDDQVSWLSSSLVHSIALMVLSLIPLLPHDRAFVTAVTAEVPPPEEPITFDSGPVSGDFIGGELPQTPDDLPALPQLSVSNELQRQIVDIGPDDHVRRDRPESIDGNGSWWPPGKSGPQNEPNGSFRNRPGPGGDFNAVTGPSKDSETAVTAALAWLAAHQLPDGSWSFDHRDGACNGRCKNPGQFKEAKNAATGLALLTFLGAGETHLQGKYQQTVEKGLRYLLATQKIAGKTGSWHEKIGNSGNYSHSIATLAVCETLEMSRIPMRRPTKSPSEMTEEERRRWKEEREQAKRRPADAIDTKRLAAASQAAIDYLVEGQNSAGGWRYNNGQAGDTSVVGWVLMAMKSAYLAKVPFSKNSVAGASKFLDSVQEGDYGSIYHYMPDKTRPEDAIRATTAIGLLCRMYLGWDRNHPGIVEGVAQLGRWRPSTGNTTDMYYNYYATQVMHHYGGQPWRDWNRAMRDYLVKTQAKAGHERGSWRFTGDHGGTAGGRLYFTTLAAMTLEVYYRYLPIYKEKSVEDDLQGSQLSPR